MHAAQIFSAALLAATAAVASPVPQAAANNGYGESRAVADILLKSAPKSASCEDAPFPEECATNKEAAPYVRAAMEKYGIYHPNEIATIISLMTFETEDFRYNRNHFPGRPGQGTRNLQLFNFNFEYAMDIPELREEALSIANTPVNGTMIGGPARTEVEDFDPESFSDEQKNAILELVNTDEYSWASGAWYYANKCDAFTRHAVAQGTEEGLAAYLVDCVHTTVTDERVNAWTLARQAFGFA